MRRKYKCLGCDGHGVVLIEDGLEIPYEIECRRCGGSGREPAHLVSVPVAATPVARPNGQNWVMLKSEADC